MPSNLDVDIISTARDRETIDWDWEPCKSLTHVVERGSQLPRRAFSVHLKPRDVSLAGAILAFTAENQVIFGVSLDDEGAKPENLERAKILLHEIAQEFGGRKGSSALKRHHLCAGELMPRRS